ncbi:MAG: class II SORL domain-containing protein [Chloroflexota bacterium]|nr:class II SORL domain-containing protein [Chloroflexota bacterium]
MLFGDMLKTAESEGKEKHVPVIEVGKGKGDGGADIVHVVVGKETPHPNTVEHHIAWVELYGIKQDGGQVIALGRAELAPSYTSPNVRFQVPVEQFKGFCAVSYCNIHGVWQNCLDV